ncbi:MAG TPA: ABC transporter permease [Thermoanaerobaculia bacterium]|nr:ABC transporter permease [Thermoanaerobaculia bacterium]
MRRPLAERILLPLGAAAALLALWWLAVRVTGATVFPSPADVLKGIGELARRGVLLSYIADSLVRVGIGFGLAIVVGIPLGILSGWFDLLDRALSPLIQSLRPISPIAWMPLAVIWFGIGNAAPVFLIFLGGVFPLVVAAADGVRNVPSIYLRAGSNFGLSTLGVLRRVVFPASLPSILTGLRIALGISWLVLVAAEMIAVDSGLGYLIIDARNAGKRYDLVVAGMLLIGLIGLLLDTGMRSVERLPSVRWGFHD